MQAAENAAAVNDEPNLNGKAVAASQVKKVALASIHPTKIQDPFDESNTPLRESIKLIGPQTPLAVSPGPDGGFNLLVGERRYWILKELGYEFADVFVIDDPVVATLWPLAENLHRVELNAMDRAQAMAEWIRLLQQLGQPGQVSSSGGRGNLGGLAEISRKTGVTRQELRRANKISAIEPAAKAAIKSAGLCDNQSLLLQIASVEPSEQAKKVADIVACNGPKDETASGADEREFQIIANAWGRARQSVRARFIAEIVGPYSANAVQQ
jgi:hypothetical protein